MNMPRQPRRRPPRTSWPTTCSAASTFPGWLARTGFQMLDPIKTAQSRLDFLRQLHDREALLPREQQRRFLASEGWIAWSGPAIAELLKQFIAHNRMMSGGFSIHGDLGHAVGHRLPGAGRHRRGRRHRSTGVGARHQAGRAAGPMSTNSSSAQGISVWSSARRPPRRPGRPSRQWVKWIDGTGDMPDGRQRRCRCSPPNTPKAVCRLSSRVAHSTAAATEMAFSLARTAADAIVAANKSARDAGHRDVSHPATARAPPGQINDHTRISLGRIMSEQAATCPNGECLLFDGRVHTYEAVDRRINNVVRGLIEVGVRQGAHVGVLMETRPSALVAIAALSRLGAVAVLMPPDADLAAAARLGGVSEIIADPSNLEAARSLDVRVLVLGGGESRDLHLPENADGRRHRHGEDRPRRRRSARLVPAQPGTGPRPGVRRVQHRSAASSSPARSPITAGRCRRSAPRRPPTSAAPTPSTA